MELTLGKVKSRPALEKISKRGNAGLTDTSFYRYLGNHVACFLNAWAIGINSIDLFHRPKVALLVTDFLVGVHLPTK